MHTPTCTNKHGAQYLHNCAAAAAAEAAAAAAAKEQPMILVDVRTANEQAVGMIPGALTQEAFEVRFATPESLPASAIVAPYCTIGYRSGRYAAQLAAKGINGQPRPDRTDPTRIDRTRSDPAPRHPKPERRQADTRAPGDLARGSPRRLR